MQKVYDKKNMWTHEGPSKKMDTSRSNVKKEKNDEHLKAHVLKKEEGRKIAMFQNNKL